MAWTPPYPGGWQTGAAGGTPITATALNAIQDGITEAVNGVNGLSTVATSGDYADLDNTPSIPSAAADVGAMPYNVRAWTGAAWTSRPTVPTGFSVECYSDGSHGSTADAAATAPSGASAGDIWWKKS